VGDARYLVSLVTHFGEVPVLANVVGLDALKAVLGVGEARVAEAGQLAPGGAAHALGDGQQARGRFVRAVGDGSQGAVLVPTPPPPPLRPSGEQNLDLLLHLVSSLA